MRELIRPPMTFINDLNTFEHTRERRQTLPVPSGMESDTPGLV
uniref:Uncharacterized protein n=1 Tax=Anguilla anguilla TaxID=7936 RepID=A0A0E9VH74_ANGAN